MDSNIEDIYEKTNIEHVSIPRKCYSKKGHHSEYSYQHLSNVLSMGNIEFFTLTVLIGKFIVKARKEVDGGVDQFFKMTKNNTRKDELTILKAVAVDEVNNPFILKDYLAMRKIWIEYSYAGFDKLYEWYQKDNNGLEEKLSEIMLSNFKENLDE
ncbi:MAG: hypothetical protein E7Z78_02140 [Methanobrevibacter thaueri]|jgi:hypothetical protein|uniref:hypothetical protein n=1 Tax=Methanobrevibacter thaueri TaxID=190975 RepID=UPI0026EE739F|nr:hypothetical protein [Methanobrevibacter thaueri]MBE6495221.1 hypothetical protein [Methanobrevibacter thaueri]